MYKKNDMPGTRSVTGTPSVYSHITTRSSANLRSTRSLKSLKTPWYRKPLVQDAFFLDVQRASMIAATFSLFLSIFTIITSCFDLYCYVMAAPGSTHYGYYVISYEFVYVGSRHVRNALVMFAVFSVLLSIGVFVTSIMLIIALRKEYEKKMLPWIYVFAVFTIFRFLAFLFFSIVNDMIFAYNILMCLFWIVFLICSLYGWVLVYSLYVELSDLTKLEDLAHLRPLGGMTTPLPDGYHAVSERLHSPVSSGLPAYDATQYGLDNASGISVITKSTTMASTPAPIAIGEELGPLSSYTTQIPSSVSKYTMASWSEAQCSHESQATTAEVGESSRSGSVEKTKF